MKKLKIALLALFVSASAFAGNGDNLSPLDASKVAERVKLAFAKNFNKAENVNWSKTEEFYFADFKLKGEDLSAAYNESGDLLGMSRQITFSQMPLAARQALEERFDNYSLYNRVTELMFDGSTSYYLGAENNDKILKLKCSPDGMISIEKTTRKKKLYGTAY